MELAVNKPGQSTTTKLSVSDVVFGQDFNESLVHQVVVAYMAKARAGTKAQKTRADVRGGGAKPWRQKGTGRARAGTTRGPIWRTGGVTFAARPRDFSQKVNRKMYRGALRSILSELLRQDRLKVVEELTLAEPKTKLMATLLADMGLTGQAVLILMQELDDNVYFASRNLPRVEVRDLAGLEPVSLVGAEQVIITKQALQQLEEQLA